MKNHIIYTGFVILGMILLIYLGISELYIREQNNLTNEIFSNAKETKQFDQFVKYQTKYYRLISSEEENNYLFVLYQIITTKDNNEHLIIVIPIDEVDMAANKNDSNDKTKLILESTNNSLNTNIYSEAISFGYNKDEIGFMFFNIETKTDETLNIKYYDYNDTLIYNKDFVIDGNITDNEITNNFEKGYTLDEIKELMDIDEKLRKTLMIRVVIYLAVAISIPFIYKLIKELIIKQKNRKLVTKSK